MYAFAEPLEIIVDADSYTAAGFQFQTMEAYNDTMVVVLDDDGVPLIILQSKMLEQILARFNRAKGN